MLTKNGAQITKTDSTRHKYADAISEYLDNAELDWSGSVECPTGAYALAGRRIVFTDDRGFVWTETYPDADGAEQVFDALELYYCDWEDDDPTRVDVLSRDDRYLCYVVDCAKNLCTAFSVRTWLVQGQPISCIG